MGSLILGHPYLVSLHLKHSRSTSVFLNFYHFKTNMKLIVSTFIIWLWNVTIPYLHRERNIVDVVNKIAPKFQDGVKAFSDSPIIGEVYIICWFILSLWLI